jgi:rod shape determining protein RodA
VLKRLFVRADFLLLAVVIALSCFGAMMVASATHHYATSGSTTGSKDLMVQIVSLLLGLGLMVLLMSIDYAKLLHVAPLILGGCAGLVLVTLVLGHAIRGSARWIPLGPLHLQPSEFAKLGVIVALAFYLSLRAEEADLGSLRVFVQSLGLAAVPAFLILLQPDLGTPLVLFFVTLTVLFMLGTRPVYLAGAVILAALLLTAAWHTNVLKEHQKARIMAFVNPDADPQGATFQLRQSLIAVGSGHFAGQGLFQGTQSNLAFIPDQETDFIFAVVGEELGFAGSVSLLALLGLLIWRCFAIAAEAKDAGGRALAVGVGAMFVLQVLVNVGMVLGVMPVKGLPLPFLSYGGSAMMTNCAAVGIVESVYMRRHKIAF